MIGLCKYYLPGSWIHILLSPPNNFAFFAYSHLECLHTATNNLTLLPLPADWRNHSSPVNQPDPSALKAPTFVHSTENPQPIFISKPRWGMERFHRFKNEMLHYSFLAHKDSSSSCHQLCHEEFIFSILIPKHWNRNKWCCQLLPRQLK